MWLEGGVCPVRIGGVVSMKDMPTCRLESGENVRVWRCFGVGEAFGALW